jgi:hypothetical protein
MTGLSPVRSLSQEKSVRRWPLIQGLESGIWILDKPRAVTGS